jgi:poly(3-hydroxybutyrate) depolymerase
VDRIEDAVTTPPPAGRARVRGERVRKLGGRRHNCLAGWTGIWDCESRKHIDLTDPFAETARWREWEASESIVTGMMGRMGEIWARRRRSPFWTMLEREMRGRLD